MESMNVNKKFAVIHGVKEFFDTLVANTELTSVRKTIIKREAASICKQIMDDACWCEDDLNDGDFAEMFFEYHSMFEPRKLFESLEFQRFCDDYNKVMYPDTEDGVDSDDDQ